MRRRLGMFYLEIRCFNLSAGND